ncbi:MAG: hypothetical protein JJ975_15865 [Bacteroidia bacterium]|nr:hypothetical protein [Bacteroidia bacterium]
MTFYIPDKFHSQSILEVLQYKPQTGYMKWIHFSSKQKALYLAFWLNFTHRKRQEAFAAVNGPENDFVVMSLGDALEHEFTILNPSDGDYSIMSYHEVEAIRTDDDPLKHWEEITGMLAVMNSEFLRFILKAKVPLDKLIRYELAIRGFDEHGDWVGFEASKELWLT